MSSTNTPDAPKAPRGKTRVEMPCQDPKERGRNFSEVALGYTKENALEEASRCLQCKKPRCVEGCPVSVEIPKFISEIAKGDLAAAFRTLKTTNSLPAVCGRVCPQENQCEGACILANKGNAVAIGRLERFVADNFLHLDACDLLSMGPTCALIDEERKVACIGGGPASLTAAGYLSTRGCKVTVFEGLHEPGGVLVYGIPEFRLPKSVVGKEVAALKEQQVDFKLNYVGGKTFSLDDLFAQGYKAVFIGVGAGLPYFLNIPGENAAGVFSANEYLTRVNLGRAFAFPEYDTPVIAGKNVTVYGGGNVAMDAARASLRLGAESVHVVYRRTASELPARAEEVEHAIEEGVQFAFLSAPISFNSDEKGRVCSVDIQRMELGEADASGRRSPVPVPGGMYQLPTDLAIVAVGTRANPILLENEPGLKLNRKGYIETDPETLETSYPNVYAGGDIVTGAATVISAMGAGRRAARAIAQKLGCPE